VSDPNQADGEFQFSMIWVLLQAESSEEASNTYESRLTGIKEFRVAPAASCIKGRQK